MVRLSVLLCFSCLFILPPASAQEIKTNENGEKIIVYPDGTWKYFNKSDDADPFGRNNTAGWEVSETAQLSQEERERYEAIQLAENLHTVASRLEALVEKAQQERQYFAEELAAMKRRSNIYADDEIRRAERRLGELEEKEQALQADLEEADKRVDLAIEAIELKPSKRKKVLEKLREWEPASSPRPESNAAELSPGRYAYYDPSKDVKRNPPPRECRYLFDGVDDFSGEKRRDVAPAWLFSFTPEALRPYLDGKEYMRCTGSLTAVSGGVTFLTLEFQIYARDALTAFGGIPNNSVLTVRLLNGETVRLFSTKGDQGMLQPNTDTYVFRGQYRLSISQEKMLAEGEADKLRVVWGTGYEDYEVYNLDFFRDQFRCLNQ